MALHTQSPHQLANAFDLLWIRRLRLRERRAVSVGRAGSRPVHPTLGDNPAGQFDQLIGLDPFAGKTLRTATADLHLDLMAADLIGRLEALVRPPAVMRC